MTQNTQRTGHPSIFNSAALDRILDEVFEKDLHSAKEAYPYNLYAHKDKDGYVAQTEILFALAGIPKESVSIKIEKNKLYVSIEPPKQTLDSNTIVWRRGISMRSSKATFSLYEVDEENVTSTFKDGLLRIVLPTAKRQSKAITIQ